MKKTDFKSILQPWLNKTIEGNSLEKLKLLPDNSIDCCVTSPPYYGLRDYGTATWVGGDKDCDHSKSFNIDKDLSGCKNGQKNGYAAKRAEKVQCKKCGAIRKDEQIGIEETPEEYVQKLVALFEEVRRVLKPTGTLWLNLGDSYWGGKGASSQAYSTAMVGKRKTLNKKQHQIAGMGGTRPTDGKHDTIKPKDLIGIPWMVAFALRDAGWYLRSSVIWNKPNPMPESVTDRPSKAHEDIFLFSKSRQYYYDAVAIRTNPTDATIQRMSQQIENQKGSSRVPGKTNGNMKAVGPGKNIRPNVDTKGGNQGSLKGIPALPANRGHVKEHQGFKETWDSMTKEEQGANGANKKSVWSVEDNLSTWKWMFTNFPKELVQPIYDQYLEDSFNNTDIWSVSTKPFKEAHFATFPEDLVVDMIKAGTSEHGCCAGCGKPYERITKPAFEVSHTGTTESAYDEKSTGGRLAKLRQATREQGMGYSGQKITTGWEKTCKCETTEIQPEIVLDPFDGARTTRIVARKLGRDGIGIELNPDYIKIGDKREQLNGALFL